MNILEYLNEKSLRNVLVLAIIAVSVYIGFEPLITLVPDGVSKAVISSSFGAIFVIILTMYLLNKQTEIEQESKRSERLFDERIKLFQILLDVTEDMIEDGHISGKEIKRLPFPYIRMCMLCDEEPIEAFKEIFDALNEIYNENSDEQVKITDEQEANLIKNLFEFSDKCRINLHVSTSPLKRTLITQSATTVTNTKKSVRVPLDRGIDEWCELNKVDDHNKKNLEDFIDMLKSKSTNFDVHNIAKSQISLRNTKIQLRGSNILYINSVNRDGINCGVAGKSNEKTKFEYLCGLLPVEFQAQHKQRLRNSGEHDHMSFFVPFENIQEKNIDAVVSLVEKYKDFFHS